MYGENMGELNVYIKPVTGNLKNVWSLSGDQGDEWKMAQVTLNSDSSEYQVNFETLESSGQSPKIPHFFAEFTGSGRICRECSSSHFECS